MESITQHLLEFDQVQADLMQLTVSALGQSQIEALTVSADFDRIETWLAEVSELKEIRAVHGALPLGGMCDIRAALARARVEGEILAPLELRQIYDTLRAGKATREFIGAIESPHYPRIQAKVAQIAFLQPVEAAIRQAIDEEGEILDGASPKLKHIRKELRHTREKIQTWLQHFLQRAESQSIIQDQVITSRHERYVIPVKASSRGKVRGIVHDQSASGMTVFIEPLETVELNNRIASLEAEEKQEIRRILLELTALVRAHRPVIQETIAILGELDFINAKARLSAKWQCNPPKLRPDRCLNLFQARHPLLLRQHETEPEQVVAIDVRMEPAQTTLLITGPNTGGKTVALKTIGLLALMVQAGMHIPVALESEISVFRHIYADIGDQQSIAQNLSTFSSHIRHIVDILQQLDERSLILLDELGAGTDPAEGASLGIALLEYLDQVGATCIATTHHDALKAYAYTHPRTMNACVEFDVQTLSPTYRLLFGLPGKSNAYIIAERLGLPPQIIQRAKALLGAELYQVEHLIRKLTTESVAIDKQKAETEARLRAATRLEDETSRLLATAAEERREMLDKALAEAKRIVEQTTRRAQEMLAKLPSATKAAGKESVKAFQKEAALVRQNAEDVKKEREIVPIAGASEIIKGQHVRLAGMGQTGIVLNISKDGKAAELQVGALRIEMPVNQLTPLSAAATPPRVQKISIAEISAGADENSVMTPELVIIGKHVEEALEDVDKYLDQAFRAGLAAVTIVHGIGTGKLKQAVATLLRAHPHVSDYAIGEYNQGATIVELKR